MAPGPIVIVVDTSVWAAFFNGAECAEVELLDGLLSEEQSPIGILPIILTEVLQGFRSDTGFRKASVQLRRLVVVEPSLDTHERAATLFRSLRRKGITVRGAIDVLIAQTCIEAGASLLTLDRDFENIARHSALGLVET